MTWWEGEGALGAEHKTPQDTDAHQQTCKSCVCVCVCSSVLRAREVPPAQPAGASRAKPEQPAAGEIFLGVWFCVIKNDEFDARGEAEKHGSGLPLHFPKPEGH